MGFACLHYGLVACTPHAHIHGVYACGWILQEMEASGVRATELLKRVRVHGSALPAHIKEPVNQAMLSAINRRAQLFSTQELDNSSSGVPQQQEQQQPTVPQHGTGNISDATLQRLVVDQGDDGALRLALLAAGHPSSAMALMHRSPSLSLGELPRNANQPSSIHGHVPITTRTCSLCRAHILCSATHTALINTSCAVTPFLPHPCRELCIIRLY
jgi:hypothetical protein